MGDVFHPVGAMDREEKVGKGQHKIYEGAHGHGKSSRDRYRERDTGLSE